MDFSDKRGKRLIDLHDPAGWGESQIVEDFGEGAGSSWDFFGNVTDSEVASMSFG